MLRERLRQDAQRSGRLFREDLARAEELELIGVDRGRRSRRAQEHTGERVRDEAAPTSEQAEFLVEHGGRYARLDLAEAFPHIGSYRRMRPHSGSAHATSLRVRWPQRLSRRSKWAAFARCRKRLSFRSLRSIARQQRPKPRVARPRGSWRSCEHIDTAERYDYCLPTFYFQPIRRCRFRPEAAEDGIYMEITKTFDVPPEIARGLASGKYLLFGGVVRDNDGHVVKMLDPVSKSAFRFAKRNPKLALAAVALVVIAGGAIFLARRFSKRARLARRLAALDVSLNATIANRPSQGLTRDDLRELEASISEFLRLAKSPEYEKVRLAIDETDKRKLLAFGKALRSFSSVLASEASSGGPEPLPELPPAMTQDVLPFVDAIWQQLNYQQRHWPTQTPPRRLNGMPKRRKHRQKE
jgi:hypothetical protein